MPFRKPCAKCGKKFQPNTNQNMQCDKCREENYKKKKKIK